MTPNTHPDAQRIEHAARERFGLKLNVPPEVPGLEELARSLEHRSHRRYTDRPVQQELLQVLFACAFSAPSKSDLQQADVIHVVDPGRRKAIVETIPDMPWIMNAPVFLIFCADNRRIRQIGDWRGKPFVNEHLDHFMNAAVDAGLVMMNFIRAAEAAGLGTCPISAVRNRAETVSGVLGLPEGVFPVAGLCVGYPAEAGRITPRLALNVTVHKDRFDESDLREKVEAYDCRRHAVLPYRRQRNIGQFGESAFYGWSEDKARQYAVPERTEFGAFIRKQGFSLK